MARTVNKDALNDKIAKLEKVINKNRQQYEKMTAEMKRLLDMRKSIQGDELFKAYASSKRSFEDIMRYIKSDPDKDGSDGQ
ncbi:MAG: hypothetical protein J6H31_02445 [Butyrivibrio sp.]|nr:hypothetical protein [Butyrivibrio sp.]